MVCDKRAASDVYFSSGFEDDEDNGEVINQGSFFFFVLFFSLVARWTGGGTAQKGGSGVLTSTQKQTLVKLNVLRASGRRQNDNG